MGISKELEDVITGKDRPDGIERVEPEGDSRYITFRLGANQTADGTLGDKLLRYSYQILVNSRSDGSHLDLHITRDIANKTATVLVSQYGIKILEEFGKKPAYVGF